MVTCPFSAAGSSRKVNAPVGQERIRVLYEEYIHLPLLKKAWDNPVTEHPELEPCFAAAMQGIELSFTLLSQFLVDERRYVAKKPRIEQLANDIRTQCQLLSEVINGELEEDAVAEGGKMSALTQDFPFEGCPPTTPGHAHSPSIRRVEEAVGKVLPQMSAAEKNSLTKVVQTISWGFTGAFQRWTVGLGIERQLNSLLELLGLPPSVPEWPTNLDYEAMVRPELVEATLTMEDYSNSEDYFFRTVHLGTECWMVVAIRRVKSALEWANRGRWHVACARVLQAANILQYLGEHVMSLTSMNMRDYLLLKVELEGTSGAGSSQVKAIRREVLQLLQPLEAGALQLAQAARYEGWVVEDHATDKTPGEAMCESGLMMVYLNPDRYPGLYNYAKALESIESALLGGFYFRHYCLAANILGSTSRGTINSSVAALRATYERTLFPVLDTVRCELTQKLDSEFADAKGRLLDPLMQRYLAARDASAAPGTAASGGGAIHSVSTAPGAAASGGGAIHSVSTAPGAAASGGGAIHSPCTAAGAEMGAVGLTVDPGAVDVAPSHSPLAGGLAMLEPVAG